MNLNSVVMAGAGTMGASLAQVYAQAGYDVTVYNLSQSGIDRAQHLVAVNQETLVAEGIVLKKDTLPSVDLEPEYIANSQIIFRDNIQPMIRGKHVLVLMASVTTGFTARRSMEAIGYYGGKVSGVAAVYRAIDEVAGYPIWSIYSVADLPEYESYDFKDCPYCKAGKKLDALVNSFGYSAL